MLTIVPQQLSFEETGISGFKLDAENFVPSRPEVSFVINKNKKEGLNKDEDVAVLDAVPDVVKNLFVFPDDGQRDAEEEEPTVDQVLDQVVVLVLVLRRVPERDDDVKHQHSHGDHRCET